MAGLADRVYIPLIFKDATYVEEAETLHRSKFRWELPKLDARRAPVCYLSAKACAAEGTVETVRQMKWLRINNIYSENVLINETKSPTVGGTFLAMLQFSDNSDHFELLPESAPKIQMSTNMKYLEFDLIDAMGEVEQLKTGDTVGTLNILLQIEYPPHENVPYTMVSSYAQSEIGNPPFSKLKL
jgi:hypothetical protein